MNAFISPIFIIGPLGYLRINLKVTMADKPLSSGGIFFWSFLPGFGDTHKHTSLGFESNTLVAVLQNREFTLQFRYRHTLADNAEGGGQAQAFLKLTPAYSSVILIYLNV